MTAKRKVRGIELRYLLTAHLLDHGRSTVEELIESLDFQGFEIEGGRPSKAVSDALRWERKRGRVLRFERGLYAPGILPRATEWRIDKRVKALREEVAALSLRGGQDSSCWPESA